MSHLWTCAHCGNELLNAEQYTQCPRCFTSMALAVPPQNLTTLPPDARPSSGPGGAGCLRYVLGVPLLLIGALLLLASMTISSEALFLALPIAVLGSAVIWARSKWLVALSTTLAVLFWIAAGALLAVLSSVCLICK